MNSSITPLTVYGSNLSYFTGKLEMYLRAKGIPYQFEPMHGWKVMPQVRRETGTSQMPAATLADGRWVSDTTPIIAWLEAQYPEPPIVPSDPVQRFFCLLLEDYADEWLWRPAMHFRWYTAEGAHLQSRHLAEELMTGMPLPPAVKRFMLRRRQRGGYTEGDGVNEANRLQVEEIYLNNLGWLQAMFEQRPFFLGHSPSLADVAFTGPFFRHFSQDPVAAEIMKQRAPAVWEWVARMWNCQAHVNGDWLPGIPQDWGPLLDDIGRTYLPYLCDNLAAVKAGQTRASLTAGGVTYPNARVSNYRIWCVEELRRHFNALDEGAAATVRQLLEQHYCWEPLWRDPVLDSGVNQGITPPFGCSDTMV